MSSLATDFTIYAESSIINTGNNKWVTAATNSKNMSTLADQLIACFLLAFFLSKISEQQRKLIYYLHHLTTAVAVI